MGAQVSVSETYVKDVLSTSTNIINKVISNTSAPTDMSQMINFEDCTDIHIEKIEQSQIGEGP